MNLSAGLIGLIGLSVRVRALRRLINAALAENLYMVYNQTMQRKTTYRKTSIAGAIAGSLCILVYLAALIGAGTQMFASIKHRQDSADWEFDRLSELALSAGAAGFMNDSYIETMRNAFRASSTLEAVIITSRSGDCAFEREGKEGKFIEWVNNAPRLKKSFSLLRQPIPRPLNISQNVVISARAAVIDYALFTVILRKTLIVIVAALAVAFFCLMIDNLAGRDSRQPLADIEPAPDSVEQKHYTARTRETGEMHAPQNGIGREEYTAVKLEQELRRCTAAGQDMVFTVISCRKKELPQIFYRAFVSEAVRFFVPPCLVFEQGARGVSIITPGADLKMGFAKAAEFHSFVLSKYPEAFTAKNDLCIGLSSRSIRSVETKRLMLEAEEALRRAVSDPASPIIAFKIDPEKYRAFINAKAH